MKKVGKSWASGKINNENILIVEEIFILQKTFFSKGQYREIVFCIIRIRKRMEYKLNEIFTFNNA